MDFNEILDAERKGRLASYDKASLHLMRQICVRHTSVHEKFATHAIRSIDEEIRRKEAQEAEHRADLTANQRHAEVVALDREKIEKISKINEQFVSVDRRLSILEGSASRSEFRTWSFWIAVASVIIALAALSRDYWGWSSFVPVPKAVTNAASTIKPKETPPSVTIPESTFGNSQAQRGNASDSARDRTEQAGAKE